LDAVPKPTPAADSTPADPTADRADSAGPGRDVRSWLILMVTAIAGCAADLVTKSMAFARVADVPVVIDRADVIRVGPGRLGALIPNHAPVRVIDGLLEFTLVLNPGAVFGIGAGKRWFFIFFTGAAILFALGLFLRWTTKRNYWTHFAIGLVLAGGLGNLYDRLIFGCVRDFLHPLPGRSLPLGWSWPWGGREIWPYVSNVADAFLIVGIAIMIGHALRHGDQPSRRVDR